MKQKKLGYRVSDLKQIFVYFHFKLLTQSVTFILQVQVSNSKVKNKSLIFELVTQGLF